MDRAINLLDRLVAQRELKLRIGAQVMLIKVGISICAMPR
jgi:hypothetical protein